jgi:hypothetical protein
LSRFRAFLLLVAFAAMATALAACGSSSSDKSSEDPQQVIDTATLQGVESGSFDLTIGITAEGKEGGDLDAGVSGQFQSEGKEKLPQLDVSINADGAFGDESVDFAAGLTLLSDKAYVEYDGTEYEVDPTTFGFVKSAIEKVQDQQSPGGASAADVTACQEAATSLQVGDFVDNLANDGSADVDGTSTTKVSGDLDVSGAIDSIVELAEDPACSAQLEAAGPLPLDELESAKGVLGEAIKKAHVDVYVGDDDIIRKVAAELSVEPPEEAGEEGPSKVDLSFELTLSDVNEEQTISAPSGAKPLNQLFQKLDVNPIELLELGSSGGLEGLLEGATPGGGSSSGGGSAATPSPENAQYLECLKNVGSAADLQKCEALR